MCSEKNFYNSTKMKTYRTNLRHNLMGDPNHVQERVNLKQSYLPKTRQTEQNCHILPKEWQILSAFMEKLANSCLCFRDQRPSRTAIQEK